MFILVEIIQLFTKKTIFFIKTILKDKSSIVEEFKIIFNVFVIQHSNKKNILLL